MEARISEKGNFITDFIIEVNELKKILLPDVFESMVLAKREKIKAIKVAGEVFGNKLESMEELYDIITQRCAEKNMTFEDTSLEVGLYMYAFNSLEQELNQTAPTDSGDK